MANLNNLPTLEWIDLYSSDTTVPSGLEIGKLQKLSDFDLSSEEVKKIMKKRYGEHIPLDETVISPSSIFESDLLETVKSN